jgi:hypothetical protein
MLGLLRSVEIQASKVPFTPKSAYRCGEQQACSSALTGDAHALPISALEQESGISLRVDCVAPPDIPLSAHRSVMPLRENLAWAQENETLMLRNFQHDD